MENKAAVCVCGADGLWELKAAFLYRHSLGNLIQNLKQTSLQRDGTVKKKED